jgi:nitrite reductase/ring-hydroxylating ferredoxin subunit
LLGAPEKELGIMQDAVIHRNIFQRVFGICATKLPSDDGCWTVENGRIIVDLARAPELDHPNAGIRLEKKHLPERVLIIRGDDGEYYAFRNRCTHGKRRLDPVPGTLRVQCCSVGKSTFDYSGTRLSGPAKEPLYTYAVIVEDGKLLIAL